ncbi:hypothetical protein ACP3V3_02465 [Vibrio sp. PNB22_3_1]
MFVSENKAFFFTVVDGTEELRSVTLIDEGRTYSALYSPVMGGVIGEATGPYQFGRATQDVVESGFVPGSTLAVFPAHFIDERMKIGYKEGYELRYGDGEFHSGFLIYSLVSQQVLAYAGTINQAHQMVNEFDRSGYSVTSIYATFKLLNSGESVVGRSLWDLVDHIKLFQSDAGGIRQQYASVGKEAASNIMAAEYAQYKEVLNVQGKAL